MILSKRSVVHMLFVVMCAVSLLFSLPYSSKAAESTENPNWMSGNLQGTYQGTKNYDDIDQYVYGNIPCENVSGYSWGLQSNGWNSWKVRTLQNQCAVATMAGHVAYQQFLPFGSDYWQTLNTSNYPQSSIFPNTGSNGLALVTNHAYSSEPATLYYTSDITSTFNSFSTDSAGNVVRSSNNGFERRLNYPDGHAVNLTSTDGISYSSNGRWMYVNVNNAGQMRIDTDNFSVLSFAPGYQQQYATFTSISNSGDTVATYNYNRGLQLYDLTDCESEKPDYGSRNCASRDITQIAQDTFASIGADGPVYIQGVKFQTESRLRLTLQYRKDNETKTGFMDLTVSVGQQSMRYLALGDSFSSGEGALNYKNGTDYYLDGDEFNLCHQSTLSYPYLLRKVISPDWFGDASCSGAVIKNVTHFTEDFDAAQAHDDNVTSQISYIRSSLLPGYLGQAYFINLYHPNVATVSMVGNDIGFGNIITSCVTQKYSAGGDCYSDRMSRESLANYIDQQIPILTNAYRVLRNNLSDKQLLYAVGYPKIISTGTEYTICKLNVNFAYHERIFADDLVEYINEAIKISANNAGVRYIDVQSAFYDSDNDYRLCGNTGDITAVNGLITAFGSSSSPRSSKKTEYPAYSESYHPNALGQSLLAKRIRALTNDFTASMPDPSLVQTTEVDDSLRTRLVGDTVRALDERGYLKQDIMDVIQERNRGVKIHIGADQTPLPAQRGSSVDVELHSTPRTLGELSVDNSGSIIGQVVLPEDIPIGYHELHLYYIDMSGQKVDLYQYIYVATSLDDYDGNGIKNDKEKCLLVSSSSVDLDKDGIDDACDGEYREYSKTIASDQNESTDTIAESKAHTDTTSAYDSIQLRISTKIESNSGIVASNILDQGLHDRFMSNNKLSSPDNADESSGINRYIVILAAMMVMIILFTIFQKRSVK